VAVARYQPQGVARVSRSNPLTRGLVGFWLPNGGGFASAIPGMPAAVIQSGVLTVSPSGRTLKSTGYTLAARIPHDLRVKPTAAITVLTAGVIPDNGVFGCENSNDGWGIYNGGAGPRPYLRVGAAWADQPTGLSTGAQGQIGLTFDGATFWTIGNGTRRNSQSISGAITNSSIDIAINATNVNGQNSSSAASTFDYVAIWNRALSPAELASFYANPWQVLETQSQLTLVAAAGGAVNGLATPTGVSATAAVGTAAASGQGKAAPLGVSASASVGTATASGAASSTAQPAGVAASASVGTASASGQAKAAPSGVSATAAVGTATASAASSSTAQPAGVSVLASIGLPVATGNATASPAGVAAVAAVGIVVANGAAMTTAFPAGVSATASVGAATVSASARATPAGVMAYAYVGTATASNGSVITLLINSKYLYTGRQRTRSIAGQHRTRTL
jgi:hypothetical protein